MSIEANIAARKEAETLLALFGSGTPREYRAIAELAASKCGCLVVLQEALTEPMDYPAALQFEATPIPHGKHAGRLVREVEPSYWVYVTESDFNRRLISYLRSKRFQEVQQSWSGGDDE